MAISMKEIGVDANPSKPGTYDVEVDGILSIFQITLDFDGQSWNIDGAFQGKRIWWFDTNKE